MEYLALPFVASRTRDGDASAVAEQLRQLINAKAAEGWSYMRLESVSTYVAGSNGCFGIGAQPGHMTNTQIAVFKR